MKLSDLVIQSLVDSGVDSAFSVTGGAAMHLNDSAGEQKSLKVMYMHNEQSCSMAAEGYARIARKPAVVIVTAGPGALNAFNGVFGAYTDSIPMIVLSGQARKNTTKSHYELNELRQLGDQEAPILKMVAEITKKSFEISEEMSGEQIKTLIYAAVRLATTGRPGPVWIEIPVDVQALDVEDTPVKILEDVKSITLSSEIEKSLNVLLQKIESSAKPVMLLGSGVKISDTSKDAIALAEKFNIPILTAWSHDVISSDHPLFFGRPGTIGTRPGNMILQNSDLLIVLGSRLNIRQISYNYEGFAPKAFKIQIDVDEEEFRKPFPQIDLKIRLDLHDFFQCLSRLEMPIAATGKKNMWLSWCEEVRKKYSTKDEDYPERTGFINAYHLVPEIIRQSPSDVIIACGDATACIVPFQTAHLKNAMSMFSNSGCASMGYDLPAALGAAYADAERQVVCFAGDGSIMMNLQELQTLAASNLNILLVILDNGGYLSIKQTQSNFFGRFHGSSPESGVTFPDFERVTNSFGLRTLQLNPDGWRTQVSDFLTMDGPRVLIAKLDSEQEFEPRLKSKMVNGKIETPSLEDMYPHVESAELFEVMNRI
jgi:acetolactate synthase-1/2/3 large subunit